MIHIDHVCEIKQMEIECWKIEMVHHFAVENAQVERMLVCGHGSWFTQSQWKNSCVAMQGKHGFVDSVKQRTREIDGMSNPMEMMLLIKDVNVESQERHCCW